MSCRQDLSQYKSASQWARCFTEAWWAQRGYCFDCSAERVRQMPGNNPACDFMCDSCGHCYELKATQKRHLQRVVDGAHDAMMAAIAARNAPTFLLMKYSRDEDVSQISTIHRVFITDEAIFKRKPLPPTAKRHGWVGCNIILTAIPPEAKIGVLTNGKFVDREMVREQFAAISGLSRRTTESIGWMAAILTRVHSLTSQKFALHDLDPFIPELQQMFPNNHYVPEKIRQQLQVLRDAGLVRFLGKGHYELAAMPAERTLLHG